MDCDKCGAVVPDGAETCPECGEAVTKPAGTTEASKTVEANETAEAKPTGGNRTMLIAAIAVAVVIVVAAGAWFALKGGGIGGGDPKTVATKMLTAYAAYDAKGILEVSTHGSLDATSTKSFEDAAAQAKKRAAGKAGVKDFSVDKVDKSNDQTATVTITGQWLTDPAKGTYSKRTEKLSLINQDGKWLVQLF